MATENARNDRCINYIELNVADIGRSKTFYGEAFGFVWTAPATEGDYFITVTDTDPRGGIILEQKVTVEAATP